MLGTYPEPAPAGKSQLKSWCAQGPGTRALADHPGKAALFLGKAKLGNADFLRGGSHHFLKGFFYLNASCKMDFLLNPLTEQQGN